MATGSEEDPEIDKSILENIYYYHLYKDRLSWTKHVIPVRVLDPRSGFFLEAYISAPAKITSLTQEAFVSDAYMPTTYPADFYVKITDIYPTTRKVTKIVDNNVVDVIPDNFAPIKDAPSIKKIFDAYPGASFTLKELQSLTNKKVNTKSLIPDKEKLCIISSEFSMGYKGYKPTTLTFPTVSMDTNKIVNSLPELYQEYKNCDKCYISKQRCARQKDNEPTFGRLNKSLINDIKIESNLICFIGEAPGVVEEQSKIAFNPTAPAGEVLNRVIGSAKIPLEKCYFTNSVLCRPEPEGTTAQNGTPKGEAIKACNLRLKNELALIKPSIIVLLGRTAYIAFYGKQPTNVLQSLGWQEQTNVYFLTHPSFVVRELSFANDEKKIEVKTAYLDHFKQIKERYDSIVSKN